LYAFVVPPVIQYDEEYKSAQTVKAGGTLLIPVSVSGFPIPKTKWYLGDKELSTSNGTTVETSEGASRLVVKNMTAAKIGTYRVTAINSAGSDEAQFTTIFKGSTVLHLQFAVRYVIDMNLKRVNSHRKSSVNKTNSTSGVGKLLFIIKIPQIHK